MSIETLRAKASNTGPALFFPDPEVPAIYNFDQGLAAPETYPVADLTRLARQVLNAAGPSVLDYFDPDVGYEELIFGYRGLRARIAERTRQMQGRDFGHAGVILTSGSVQGLALAMAGYVDPGDVVIAEASSFPYALRYATMQGGEVRTLTVDDNGMVVEDLEGLIAQVKAEGKRVKMVYTIPTFQTPTGTEMSVPRRKMLVEAAKKHDFIIIEDAVYSDLRFSGEPLPSLLSLDDSGRVIQCGSFSKMVAPALRMGWFIGDLKAIEPLAVMRQDLGVAQWIARVMADFMDEGLLEPHLARVCQVYGHKANIAAKALREHCGDFVRFRMPQGSFYIWVEIDDRVDWDTAAARAAKEGIFFRPGERFAGVQDDRKFLRLSYGHVSEKIIAEGIARLGAILHECVRKAA
ncbi:PLP-dependent aminotransferase family protein [Aquamicrobium sp. LC103]|uniref:aminotransferase-like domain-containing protein n=1 Tax=Aquamicrobium sp. LC103 TaxID=1120658 RepID=UPI000A79189C|nr:PLP-dependent aminotransferase family protein [Aquamicrobium sp. LC103]TKT75733.1 PLP-dependent aminotransferase family protein [Aquamicrobium sp. LC103]